MYGDIYEGLYNQIIEKYGYDHLQIQLKVKSQKVDDKWHTKKVFSMSKLKS